MYSLVVVRKLAANYQIFCFIFHGIPSGGPNGFQYVSWVSRDLGGLRGISRGFRDFPGGPNGSPGQGWEMSRKFMAM